jgi:hypothetical protein
MCAGLRTRGELPIGRGSSRRVELRVWADDRARHAALLIGGPRSTEVVLAVIGLLCEHAVAWAALDRLAIL